MKRFPIICPDGAKVIITQGFQPKNNPTHDAIDFIIGNPRKGKRENARLSYASQLVCPVKEAKCVLLNNFGEMNDLGNGVDIEWQEDGYYWRLHFWHTCYEQLVVNDIINEGGLVALMGNTGDCRPKPTPERPYDGTHCHMRLSRYQKDQWGFGNINTVSLDPLLYFDMKNPYIGADSSILVDLEPIKWAWNLLGIKDNLSKLLYFIKFIFN